MVLRAIDGPTINPQTKYTSPTAIPHADLQQWALRGEEPGVTISLCIPREPTYVASLRDTQYAQ